jgi:hypothetical protein
VAIGMMWARLKQTVDPNLDFWRGMRLAAQTLVRVGRAGRGTVFGHAWDRARLGWEAEVRGAERALNMDRLRKQTQLMLAYTGIAVSSVPLLEARKAVALAVLRAAAPEALAEVLERFHERVRTAASGHSSWKRKGNASLLLTPGREGGSSPALQRRPKAVRPIILVPNAFIKFKRRNQDRDIAVRCAGPVRVVYLVPRASAIALRVVMSPAEMCSIEAHMNGRKVFPADENGAASEGSAAQTRVPEEDLSDENDEENEDAMAALPEDDAQENGAFPHREYFQLSNSAISRVVRPNLLDGSDQEETIRYGAFNFFFILNNNNIFIYFIFFVIGSRFPVIARATRSSSL